MPLVLAIEPDPRQALTLERVVKDYVRAELVVVDSRDAALAVITDRVPDLILVSALLGPRDEEDLTHRLKSLDHAAHLQTLTIPLFATEEPEEPTRGGIFGAFRRKRRPNRIAGCDPALFAREIETYLQRAAELREDERLGIAATAVRPIAPATDTAQTTPPTPYPGEETTELHEPWAADEEAFARNLRPSAWDTPDLVDPLLPPIGIAPLTIEEARAAQATSDLAEQRAVDEVLSPRSARPPGQETRDLVDRLLPPTEIPLPAMQETPVVEVTCDRAEQSAGNEDIASRSFEPSGKQTPELIDPSLPQNEIPPLAVEEAPVAPTAETIELIEQRADAVPPLGFRSSGGETTLEAVQPVVEPTAQDIGAEIASGTAAQDAVEPSNHVLVPEAPVVGTDTNTRAALLLPGSPAIDERELPAARPKRDPLSPLARALAPVARFVRRLPGRMPVASHEPRQTPLLPADSAVDRATHLAIVPRVGSVTVLPDPTLVVEIVDLPFIEVERAEAMAQASEDVAQEAGHATSGWAEAESDIEAAPTDEQPGAAANPAEAGSHANIPVCDADLQICEAGGPEEGPGAPAIAASPAEGEPHVEAVQSEATAPPLEAAVRLDVASAAIAPDPAEAASQNKPPPPPDPALWERLFRALQDRLPAVPQQREAPPAAVLVEALEENLAAAASSQEPAADDSTGRRAEAADAWVDLTPMLPRVERPPVVASTKPAGEAPAKKAARKSRPGQDEQGAPGGSNGNGHRPGAPALIPRTAAKPSVRKKRRIQEPPATRLAPLAVWARAEHAARPGESSQDLKFESLACREESSPEAVAALRFAEDVAGVRYASGCRIRRVRIAPPKKAHARDHRVLILSRKALRELL